MNRKTLFTLVTSLLTIVTVACGGATPTATPDVQETVAAAISATETAQANVEATPDVQMTVEAVISATGTAQANAEATVAAAVEATSVAAPMPTPSAEYVTMTEEELAALIDQAVTEASAATQQCSTAVTEVTTDDNVTQEEVDTVTVYVARMRPLPTPRNCSLSTMTCTGNWRRKRSPCFR